MIVAGLQKLSLVDFPGKLAAVVFLQGCNFRCGYCQNPDLIAGKGSSSIEESEVLGYLTRRKEKLEAVVVTGGEPTAQPGLAGFLRKVSGAGLKVKLDTNGSDPGVLKELLSEGLLDYIAVDIKTSFRKYHLISSLENVESAVAESVRICLKSGIPYEFRTTCVPGVVEEEDFHRIGREVKGAGQYYLQQFRPNITYDPSFLSVSPFTFSQVKRFSDILSGYVDEVKMRGF